ncbi:MAG: hypothetical protein P8Z35_09420, partial [Ignavibacteriaceae bacterium]
GDYNDNLKNLLFDVYDTKQVKSVNLGGKSILEQQNPDEFEKADEGFYFNKDKNLLKVKVNYSDKMELQIQ